MQVLPKARGRMHCKDKKCETEVPKGFLCPGCISFTATQNRLSPYCILFCVSSHKEHICPPKTEVLELPQKYFGGWVSQEIRAEKIGIGAFLCSWSGDFTPTQLGRRKPEPRTKTVYSGVKDTVNLSQWINHRLYPVSGDV